MIPSSGSQAERDVMEIIRQTLAEEAADEYWSRMFDTENEGFITASVIGRKERNNILRALKYASMMGSGETMSTKELVTLALGLNVSIKGRGRTDATKAVTGSVEEKTRSLLRLRKQEG